MIYRQRRHKFWLDFKITGIWLKAMRIMRGKTCREIQGIIKVPASIENLEKSRKQMPGLVVEQYIEKLGITKYHLIQFEKMFKGELKTFSEGRGILPEVKKEVRKKCNNKCVKCDSKGKLHFHHKERYSKGGQNTIDNLILLCAKCHAEEHKNEPSYHLLLSKIGDGD